MKSTDQEVRQRFLDRIGNNPDEKAAIHLLRAEQDEELLLMLAACTGRARRLVAKVLADRGHKVSP